MIKFKAMKLRNIYVVLFGVLLLLGVAQVQADKDSVPQTVMQGGSLDSIVAGTQQQVSQLAEQLQTYQIQAERERKHIEVAAKEAEAKVSQARLEMVRAQNLLQQLSARQGASIGDSTVDDIVKETQRQVVQLTVKLQSLQIEAEREKRAAESKINDVQLKIEQLAQEKIRVENLMKQLSTPSATNSRPQIATYPQASRSSEAVFSGINSSSNSSSNSVGQPVMVMGDVLFDNNSATLKRSAGIQINMIVDYLMRNPERSILIAGHTDRNGKSDYNLELSERRAKSVLYALLEKGVPFKQLRVAAFGDTRPKVYSKGLEGNIQNRRVEIVVLE
ncbi:MAG: OmpA family protein [Nitrosomonas sp.]|nr:OmpA family protein [Nitrosomonas sp.]